MRKAVDLSNFTTSIPVPGGGAAGGFITAQNVADWKAAGYTHAIIGSQWPAVARHQLAVCIAGGMTVDLYSWLSWSRDQAAYIGARLELHRDFPQIGRHWLDAEEDAGGRAPEEICRQIKAAVDALQGFPAGIYTGRWWWPATGDSKAFNALPLWIADYRQQEPTFDQFVPFGGWTRPLAWQWAGSVVLAGTNLDLNLIEDAEESTMPNLSTDGADRLVSEPPFIVLYHGNVPIRRYGATDGSNAGREAWNFGGSWQWVRHFNPDGTWNPVGYLSDQEGD